MHLTSPCVGLIYHLLLKFNNKWKDYLRALDLNCKKKKKKLNNLVFSALLSNITNLVVSNGSEHLQNVIQSLSGGLGVDPQILVCDTFELR